MITPLFAYKECHFYKYFNEEMRTLLFQLHERSKRELTCMHFIITQDTTDKKDFTILQTVCLHFNLVKKTYTHCYLYEVGESRYIC